MSSQLSFLRDERGTVTVFAIVAFAMMIAFIGLVMDVGRVMNVHSQAHSYVDRVALAAASELDGRNGALTRAIAAAEGADAMVDDGFRLTLSGDSVVNVRQLTFLETLGADPTDPYDRSPVAGDVVVATWTPGGGLAFEAGYDASSADLTTNFVLVDSSRETENYVLFPILAALVPGMETQATVAPQAIAGFERQVCNNPPLMICNLNEATGGAGADYEVTPGQMIAAKMQGPGASWGPGVFGLLDAIDGEGAAAVRDAIARLDPNSRCVKSEADVKPGQNVGPISQGMNVRFDMFGGPMNGVRNNAQYPPAANVLKGLKTANGSCNTSKSTTSTPFPRDNCFMPAGVWPNGIASGAGTGCLTYGGVARAGDTNWDRANYWATNHIGDAEPAGYGEMSRYEVYREEINNTPPGTVDTVDEQGDPTCSSVAPTTDPNLDRRVLIVAIVNCVEYEDILNGNAEDVPVEHYAKVFLTEPIGNTAWWGASNADIFIEMIGIVDAAAPATKLREFPVLYR